MTGWNVFLPFSLAAILLWTVAAVLALRRREGVCRWALSLTMGGILVYVAFIVCLWVGLERPPFRTLGETRLWYSLFMMVSGWMVYARWRYRWILLFSLLVATVFIVINLLRPDIHDQSLMPALQSPWFIPHVSVYMFSYSVLGCACLLAVAGLWRCTDSYLPSIDRLVHIGWVFLSFGMLSGCIWAKAAWGQYWTWDPKETWAAATWSCYLVYVHLRLQQGSRLCSRNLTEKQTDSNKGSARFSPTWPYVAVIVGFLLLQMCWYGVNLLPVSSLHSYTN
ncbi:MAG: cytochrome c biogenesis protein CcsA [Alloprevotella sp.]